MTVCYGTYCLVYGATRRVFVAHELKFFELLADKPLTLEEICKAKELTPRPAHTLLAVCTSIGLMALRDGR
ncbi:MAG: methyltransferase dimerization domain-containing protein [Candidatus Binataceae bacterium]